jgi:hypothetical protein
VSTADSKENEEWKKWGKCVIEEKEGFGIPASGVGIRK